jgi:hypothetical protein
MILSVNVELKMNFIQMIAVCNTLKRLYSIQ